MPGTKNIFNIKQKICAVITVQIVTDTHLPSCVVGLDLTLQDDNTNQQILLTINRTID